MTTRPDRREPTDANESIPVPPPHFVERRRLDHVYAGAVGRVIRVLAPSGYGKTSLVARWVAAETRQVRWIDLTSGDDDPVALFGTISDALAGIVELRPPSAEHFGALDPYVAALEPLAVNPAPDPFVLVLDDVHRLESGRANLLVAAVIARMSPASTVVLVGRGHHDHGSIGRLRLAPGVVDVAVQDLAFDESESYRLLDMMGVETSRPDVAELVHAIEGWPAGVRLAGQVASSGAPLEDVTEHVSLVDFLRDEWTGRLEEGDRAFLRDIACLPTFTGEQCEAVLERHACAQLLRRLHRDQVVVFALDERDDRYRMHGLLRRWLSDELRDRDPERWARIHLNAATYAESRGDIDRAAQHLLAVGDLEALERLAVVHGGPYFTRGLDATVERWLGAFPSEHVRRSPGLCGLECVGALHRSDDVSAVHWLRMLDEAVSNRGHPPDDPTVWWGGVLHAALDERPAAEMIPIVEEARVQLPGGAWAGFACWTHGALCFLDGDLVGAVDALRTGVFEAELAGNQLIVAHCRGTLSLIADCDGDQTSAAKHATAAERALRACGGELRPPAAPAIAAIALQQARRGDRDDAARSMLIARTSLRGFGSVAPWFNVVARLALIRAGLLLDDRPTARALVGELEHHARFEPWQPESNRCSAITVAHELRTQVEAMHVPATGSSALTDAELRVLHLLPTNLSLAEIAMRLFLSRNTVKSHAASIYRKLDAAKRADAVERARAAGLLTSSPP